MSTDACPNNDDDGEYIVASRCMDTPPDLPKEGIVHNEERVGCCDVFISLMKACGLCCYMFCPPVPECITRKMAFHPPKRGVSYTLHLDAQPDKKVTDARMLVGKPFTVRPMCMRTLKPLDYETMLAHTTTGTTKTAHGSTIVWMKFSPPRPSREEVFNNQIIIFAQPNSSDLGSFLQPYFVNFPHLAEILATEILAFDYTGYGYSSGSPSEGHIYGDLEAVYKMVREQWPEKKIVLLGYSIGTSAAIDLASKNKEGVVGTILIAPFTSGLRLMSQNPQKEATCCMDRFRSYDKASRILSPTLVIHGSRDNVIPMEHGRVVHSRLQRPVTPLFVHGADHQNIFNGAHPMVFTRIYSFLKHETLLAESSASRAPAAASPGSTSAAVTNQPI